jgi:hypothetical protein
MRYIALLTVGLAALSAPAAEPTLVITKAGYWLLSEDAAGVPSLTKLTRVDDRTGGTTPIPPPVTPPPTDPPPVGTAISEQVRQWSSSISHPLGRQALALIYKTVGERVDAGTIPPDQAFLAVKATTDATFNAIGGAENWTAWRQKVGALAETLQDQGKLTTKAQVGSFMGEVAAGLSAAQAQSSPDEAAVGPETLNDVQALIDLTVNRLFVDSPL